MKPKSLGTILPTAKSLAINDAYAIDLTEKQRQVAKQHLSDCVSRIVGMEQRYYLRPTIYAIVDRHLTIRWIEHRADGDYALKGKP